MHRKILLVHNADEPWGEFAARLTSPDFLVETSTALSDAQLRIRARRPDVVVLDGGFEHGIDLLLNSRQTASGQLLVVVRKVPGSQTLYAATFPGADPREVGPLSADALAREVHAALVPPPRPAAPRLP